MKTIISQRVPNPLTKKMEMQSSQINIIRCKYFTLTNHSIGADLLFSIINFKDKIKEKLPKCMDTFKENLHGLDNLDDALHLMQFML